MLTNSMCDHLNKQIVVEFFSSNLYLQMSSWAATNGLNGTSAFLRRHSDEERMHMMKFYDYLLETGNQAIVPALDKPEMKYDNLLDLFTKVLDHEKFVTSRINELVDAAWAEKDYSTFNFLQWFVAEQHEEEALFSGILDKIKLIGTEGRGLFLIDKEIGSTNTAA